MQGGSSELKLCFPDAGEPLGFCVAGTKLRRGEGPAWGCLANSRCSLHRWELLFFSMAPTEVQA